MAKKVFLVFGSLIIAAGLIIGISEYNFYRARKNLAKPIFRPTYSEYRFVEEKELKNLAKLGEKEKIKKIGRIISSRFHTWLDNLEERATKEGKYIRIKIKTQNCWDNGLPELGKTYLQMCDLDQEGGYLEKAKGVARFLLKKQTETGGWGREIVIVRFYNNEDPFGYLGDNFSFSKNKRVKLYA